MKNALKKLCKDYPLGPNWEMPELIHETSTLFGQPSEAIGLVSKRKIGPPAFASAAGLQDPWILKRAYFELIERTSILDAEQSDKTGFTVIPQNKANPLTLTRAECFPSGSEIGTWSYSKSNGVATHSDLELAKKSAVLEILERDAVLRSWYLKQSPYLIEPSEIGIANPDPSGELGIKIVCFPQSVPVLGVFGFPKAAQLPIFFGFGAGFNQKEVYQHAWNEALQRLIFTSEDPLPETLPSSKATPDFHLDYYLCPASNHIIKEWLNSNPSLQRPDPLIKADFEVDSFTFIDLTPEHLKGVLWVVKAISKDHIPLTFGNWDPILKREIISELVPHPIA